MVCIVYAEFFLQNLDSLHIGFLKNEKTLHSQSRGTYR